MSGADDQEARVLTAARLRAARDLLGLTQQDVADAIRIPRPSVAAIEAGKRGVSTVELRQFARLYRRPVTWLLGEDEDEHEHAAALLRATETLSEDDRAQVLRFAQFLATAGKPPRRGLRAEDQPFTTPTLDPPAP